MLAEFRRRSRVASITALLLCATLALALAAAPRGVVRAASLPTPPASGSSTLSTITVTTTADVVDGDVTSISRLNTNRGTDRAISLREAILATNATARGTPLTIAFSLPLTDTAYLNGVWTFRLRDRFGQLPALTRGNVVLDGTMPPGALVLDGGYDPPNSDYDFGDGLTISSSNNVVRGLVIQHFSYNGIVLGGGDVRNNTIEGVIIRGNVDQGILLDGTQTANGDQTAYNRITGSTILDNANGVLLKGGAHDNLIGGPAAVDGNRLSGNQLVGVQLSDVETINNTVAGNWIGLDADGRTALPNGYAGVRLLNTSLNLIGGLGAGNVISGNEYGVLIEASTNVTLAGNIIGLSADGSSATPNVGDGVALKSGSRNNLIGGSDPAARNLIGGNGTLESSNGNGIHILDSGTSNNRIQGNIIGRSTGPQGELVGQGNTRYGVLIHYDARDNLIGGSGPGEGNVIAYNGFGGIRIDSDANQVSGNLIGVGADQQTPLGNQYNGIKIGGADNIIGPGNTIGYNALSGIMLGGANSVVLTNTLAFNARSGICIAGPQSTIVGNTIRSNGSGSATSIWNDCNIRGGVIITGTGDTLVQDNQIYDNIGAGITVRSGAGNRLLTNSISGNTNMGISLEQGGNAEVAPPVIKQVTANSDMLMIIGQSCASCRIEVFSDTGDEGRYFVDTTSATDGGSFSVTVALAQLRGAFITATMTDANHNTSPFARSVRAGGDSRIMLPFVRR